MQRNRFLNWLDNRHLNLIGRKDDADNNVYNPGTYLYRYIDWTFYAGFMSVFVTFLFIYFFFCVLFGLFLMLAGDAEPECITASGDNFGANPNSRFSDAFALSWNTFTTVGYGMAYTSTSTDLGDVKPSKCTLVILLTTVEAFTGLLFAGMCAAILFGKVNRIQSHANIIFCNAVCLQYEEMEEEEDLGDIGDSRHPNLLLNSIPMVPEFDVESAPAPPQDQVNALKGNPETPRFMDQFDGCPVLKFQVVNEHCNREGSEIVDAIMKVVGIKFKGPGGHVTHSQYVRVNLMDFEHPFLSRVWTGVHVLDSTSPLLNDSARKRIRDNNGSWPSHWFDPDVIRSKLEFHDLIVTIAGISNVSAVTVHAYKRYKIGDVLIGYNFAPIVFRDPDTSVLEVDLSMVNDVREQSGMRGEDLSARKTPAKDVKGEQYSSIRIKKSKSGVGFNDGISSSMKKSRSGISLSSLSDKFSRRSSSVKKSQSSISIAGLGDSLSGLTTRHSPSIRKSQSGISLSGLGDATQFPRHSSSMHGGRSANLLAGLVDVTGQPADKTSKPVDKTGQPPIDLSSIRESTPEIDPVDLGDVNGLGVPWNAGRISASRKSRVRRATMEGLPPPGIGAFGAKPDGLAFGAKPDGLAFGAKPDGLAFGAKPDGLAFKAKPDNLAFKAKSPMPSGGNNGFRRNVSSSTMLVSNLNGGEGHEPEVDVEAGIIRDGRDKDNGNGQDEGPLITVG